jgi:hypothetical protein
MTTKPDISWGLPAAEAAVFINYVNAATALIMLETGKTIKQAHAALSRKKRSAAVEDILDYLRGNPETWLPK